MTPTNHNPEAVIEFIEKICGCKLYGWQKYVIRKLYEMDENERYVVMCRYHGRATILDLLKDFKDIMNNT